MQHEPMLPKTSESRDDSVVFDSIRSLQATYDEVDANRWNARFCRRDVGVHVSRARAHCANQSK